MSYASMGATTIFNVLKHSDVLMVTEGLNVFRVALPPSLAGTSIAETTIRQTTGCTMIAIELDGIVHINADPAQPLPAGVEMILIGTADAEQQFLQRYGNI